MAAFTTTVLLLLLTTIPTSTLANSHSHSHERLAAHSRVRNRDIITNEEGYNSDRVASQMISTDVQRQPVGSVGLAAHDGPGPVAGRERRRSRLLSKKRQIGDVAGQVLAVFSPVSQLSPIEPTSATTSMTSPTLTALNGKATTSKAVFNTVSSLVASRGTAAGKNSQVREGSTSSLTDSNSHSDSDSTTSKSTDSTPTPTKDRGGGGTTTKVLSIATQTVSSERGEEKNKGQDREAFLVTQLVETTSLDEKTGVLTTCQIELQQAQSSSRNNRNSNQKAREVSRACRKTALISSVDGGDFFSTAQVGFFSSTSTSITTTTSSIISSTSTTASSTTRTTESVSSILTSTSTSTSATMESSVAALAAGGGASTTGGIGLTLESISTIAVGAITVSASSSSTAATSTFIPPSSTSITETETSTTSSSLSLSSGAVTTDQGTESQSQSEVAASASESASATGGNPVAAADTNPTATAAAASQQTSSFVLPGKDLSVLPIGLGVFAGVSVLALIVVGVVTYERRKFRAQFRQRKMQEQIASAAGFGTTGDIDRPTVGMRQTARYGAMGTGGRMREGTV